jgi:hypothetical protein
MLLGNMIMIMMVWFGLVWFGLVSTFTAIYFSHNITAKKPQKTDTAIPLELANQAWLNLNKALKALEVKVEDLPDDEEDEDDNDQPATKRSKLDKVGRAKKRKKKRKKKKKKYTILDPYNICIHTIRKPEEEEDDDDEMVDEDPFEEAAKELKSITGGKLTQLTVSGIFNGMVGVSGGIVTNKLCDPIAGLDVKAVIPSAANASFAQLKSMAGALHKAVVTRIEADVLVTTPIRIQEMLAPDLTQKEFKVVRRRIIDTVMLGKGLAQPEGLDIPTANSSGVHDIEKFKKCKSCGNNNQSAFVLDRKNGDVICENCGTVATESLMHEGSQFRKFEGEADRNHHGDAPNRLYSNAHNMSTTLSGVQMTTGAGIGGFGSGKRGLETVLRNAHAFTELNISQFGKGDRRTRTGYKDKQKKDAFSQMTHCGDALNLHEAVVQRAKELFAGFRDDRELVQQFKPVVAACLCEAFDQLSQEGKNILKQKLQEPEAENFTSARASRRSGLHHANMAGRGGILLDDAAQNRPQEEQPLSSVAQKVASTWDLDDCRSWLLEASRSIAQQWIMDRKKGVNGIPAGRQEELEGNLVEHAIVLCNALETELKQQQQKQSAKGGRGRVVTPRVNDMAMLGIKWQHAHERGSGGKGGVGNNVQTKQVAGSGRTAGQILSLKTAKKLGMIIKDSFAGEAIHKELRSVVGKQEAKKRQELRADATRQRFMQMKRKPWLQARMQVET